MIRTFRSRSLERYWRQADASRLSAQLVGRIRLRLSALDAAATPAEMNVPGFDFHGLRGRPQRYSVHVNGPWCITFGWSEADAIDVDLENYH